jgi:TfoX/Sxy family transcriptional regulator of competence genes
MATSPETIQYLCDQAGLGARLTTKRMFGEYAVYVDTKVVAFVCDDQLFLKPTDQGRTLLGQPRLAPAYPGSKDYFVLVDELDDPELLREALCVTADALPTPKPKAAAKAKAKAKRRRNTVQGKR